LFKEVKKVINSFRRKQVNVNFNIFSINLIPICISLWLVYFTIDSAELTVSNFEGRIIGIATLENFSVNARVRLYYISFLLFLFLYSVITILLRRLGRFISKTQKNILNIIGFAGIVFLLFITFKFERKHEQVYFAATLQFLLIFLFITLKRPFFLRTSIEVLRQTLKYLLNSNQRSSDLLQVKFHCRRKFYLKLDQLLRILEQPIFISFFYSLWFISYLNKAVGLSIADFKDKIIGIYTINNYTIDVRLGLYLASLLLFLLVLYVVSLLVMKVYMFLTKEQKNIWNTIGFVGIVLFLLNALKIDMMQEQIYFVAFLHVYVTILTLISPDWLKNHSLLYTIITFCLLILIVFMFLGAEILLLFSIKNFILWQILSFCALSILIIYKWFLLRYCNKQILTRKFNRLIILLKPLLFIPLLTPLSDELYLILNNRGIFSIKPIIIYGFMLAFLIILSLILSFRSRNINLKDEAPNAVLTNFYFPVLIVTITFFTNYTPFIPFSQEMFENGNTGLSIQQFYDYGTIPYLENFDVHSLNEQFFSFLYTLFNGFNGTSYQIYNIFMLPTVSSLLMYILLVYVTGSPYSALFLILFFPFIPDQLLPYYNTSILSLVALLNSIKKQTLTAYLLLILSILFNIMWRLDLGFATLLATVIAFTLISLSYKNLKIINLKNLLKACLITLTFGSITLLLVVLYTKGEVLSRLIDIMHMIKSEQTFGFTILAQKKDPSYYMHYFVFPFIILMIVTFSVIKVRKNEILFYPVICVFFLGAFYFSNFQRGLVRHSLVENTDIFISSYVFFIIPSVVFIAKNELSILKKLVIYCFVSFILLYAYKVPWHKNTNEFGKFLTKYENQFSEVEPKQEVISRTYGNYERFRSHEFREIEEFMNNKFGDQATFIDFTNTPMLYFHMHRKSPGYFNQHPLLFHNEYLQNRYLEDLEKHDAPLAIFNSMSQKGGIMSLDNVPNNIRHYLIAEYIYQNYKPLAILNGRACWIKKELASSIINNKKVVYEFNKKNPSKIENDVINTGIIFKEGKQKSFIDLNFRAIPLKFKSDKRYFLQVKTDQQAGTMKAFLKLADRDSIENLSIEAYYSKVKDVYSISIPYHIDLAHLDIRFIFETENLVNIEKVSVIVQDFEEDYASFAYMSQDMRFLPLIWGKYDKAYLDGHIKVQQSQLVQPTTLKPKITLDVPFDPALEKKSGNYIRIRAKNIKGQTTMLALKFGDKNLMRGDYIFALPGDSTTYDFLIRVSSQFNWYNRNNNLLKLEIIDNQEGLVKIEDISILKGDNNLPL
jgi:hypothetical protein